MVSIEAVVTAVQAALVADTGAGGVNTLVVGHIYKDYGHDSSVHPQVVHTFFPGEPWGTFDADSIDGELQVDVMHHTRRGEDTSARTVAARVHTLFHRKSISITGRSNCAMLSIDQGVPTFDQDLNKIVQRFRLWSSP